MSEAKPPRVFLSYSRPDRARVAKLAEALTAAGIAVWWDTAIEGGASFSADIERELDAADVVVVAWSAASVKSTWVLDEAGAGRDRGRLVPVQLDATLPPLGFRQFQAIDLSAWKGRAGDAKVAALVSAIHKLAGAEVVAPLAKAAPATIRPSRRVLIGGAAGVAALAAGGFGAWKFLGQKADDGTASVVVLPFANLSGDPAQAFFSDGIAEELRNALAQIRGLKVIGRVSSEAFRDAKDVTAAAEKLGVEHVLTGSVRRSPTTIRIAAQLVDGRTGVESWSASYDQPVGDALAIQSKIATSVVAALSAKLGAAVGAIAVGGTRNPQAQTLFLQAEQLARAGTTTAFIRPGYALLEAALALDPSYADAWAMKANIENLMSYAETTPAGLQRWRDAQLEDSGRAVALAPNSGLAHMALALSHRTRLDIRKALAEAETALRLAPADARVLSEVSNLVRVIDPDRSVGIARAALALDPLNPAILSSYAGALLSARRREEALAVSRQAMEMSNNAYGGNTYVSTLFYLGRLDEARANLKFVPFGSIQTTLRTALDVRSGNSAVAERALANAAKIKDDATQFRLAIAYAVQGDKARALAAIEASLRIRETAIWQISILQSLDPLRNEPRFKAVQDAVIPPDLWVPPKRGLV